MGTFTAGATTFCEPRWLLWVASYHQRICLFKICSCVISDPVSERSDFSTNIEEARAESSRASWEVLAPGFWLANIDHGTTSLSGWHWSRDLDAGLWFADIDHVIWMLASDLLTLITWSGCWPLICWDDIDYMTSDWLRKITCPGYWPLSGWHWSRDLDTGL